MKKALVSLPAELGSTRGFLPSLFAEVELGSQYLVCVRWGDPGYLATKMTWRSVSEVRPGWMGCKFSEAKRRSLSLGFSAWEVILPPAFSTGTSIHCTITSLLGENALPLFICPLTPSTGLCT